MTSEIESTLLSSLQLVALESRREPWDTIVVGGGTAGCVAARTLIEKGLRVAILEAGPLLLLGHSNNSDIRFDPVASSAVRDLVRYSPRLANGDPFGRLLGCVGGRSLFWNGAAPRYSEHAFDNWPFRYNELDSAYAWAETDFRVSRDFGSERLTNQVCRSLVSQGFYGEAGPFAIDTHPTANGWISGTIANAVTGLLRTGYLGLQSRPLRLAGRTFVSRIIFDPSRTKARGVVAVDRESGETYEIFSRSVVLAAGALESARLALASDVLDQSGMVGKCVTDHLFCRAYYLVPPETYDANQPEAAIVFVPSNRSQEFQLEIHLPGNSLFMQKSESTWSPTQTIDYAAMVRSFGPVESRPENHIALTGAEVPGAYTVHFSYSSNDLALQEKMRDSLEKVRIALNATPIDPTILPPGASYHEAGGLIMGTNSGTSVTDTFGRFHKVLNLLAVDASTWPYVGAANPHLTIAAISRRQSLQLAIDLIGSS